MTQVLEGTWEEIALQSAQFAGRRVRLIVLGNEQPEVESQAVQPNDAGGKSPPDLEGAGVTLDRALIGLIGVVDSSSRSGGVASRLSEDAQAFGSHLERKREEGRL